MPKKRQPRKSLIADKEGNKYDKIIKENLESLIPALLRSVIRRVDIRLEDLPQIKLQTTIEREPDFSKKMFSQDYPTGCILQIEFEGKDEKETDYRMLEYGAIMIRKYKLPIEQHLVCLLEKEPQNIKGGIELKNIKYQFRVHRLSQIHYKNFIGSDKPEEVVLSILSNYEGEPPETIIRLILERLLQLRGNSLAIRKFIKQLEILSGLRKLQTQTTKIIDNMVIEYDITQDVRYQQGQEKGKIKQSIIGIINMANKGFDITMTAEVLEVTPDFAASILEQYQQKEDIISLLKKRRAKVEKVAAKLNVNPILVEVIQEDMEE